MRLVFLLGFPLIVQLRQMLSDPMEYPYRHEVQVRLVAAQGAEIGNLIVCGEIQDGRKGQRKECNVCHHGAIVCNHYGMMYTRHTTHQVGDASQSPDSLLSEGVAC